MADYNGNVLSQDTVAGFGDSNLGLVLDADIIPGFAYPSAVVPLDIIQRIYDSSAGWCQYTKATFDPAPAPGETEPNHTGNLVAGTHQKLGEI